ncbi:MAG: hypothetical protein ACE5F1_01440 [Planctomycetota bacterium]
MKTTTRSLLAGAEIVEITEIEVPGYRQAADVLIVRRPNGSMVAVTVMADPEGNGPGALHFSDLEV